MKNTSHETTPWDRFRLARNLTVWGGSLLLALAATIAGREVGKIVPLQSNLLPAIGLGFALAAAYVILPVLSLIRAKQYAKAFNEKNVADLQAYMLSHRENVEKTMAEKLSLLRKLLRHATLLAVLYGFLGLLIALCPGFLQQGNRTLWAILATLLALPPFICVLSRIHVRTPEAVATDDLTYVAPDDFPALYALGRRAADAQGCQGGIRLYVPAGGDAGCNASISRDGDRYNIWLGAELIGICTEPELYCVLLHEFGHIVADVGIPRRETAHADWLYLQSNGLWAAPVVHCPFLFVDSVYTLEFNMYRYAASIRAEQLADRLMLQHGDANAAASSLIKLEYAHLYTEEDGVRETEPLYASEQPEPALITKGIQQLLAAIPEGAERWNRILDGQIMARSATHPTLRMRLDSFGVAGYPLLAIQPDDPLTKERARVLERMDKLVLDQWEKKYPEFRKAYYEKPLAHVNAWEQAGEPLVAETYVDLLDDLISLRQISRAYALCERAIAELSPIAAAHACYMKGLFLLRHYDEHGIEYIYQAIEQNSNYIEGGLSAIGEFCCTMGRQDDLECYRARALELGQKKKDLYDELGELTRNDRLSEEHLPDGMLEKILSFMHIADATEPDGTSRMPCIREVYLVRKTITEDFFASVFVIRFLDGTAAPRREDVMHRIFCYLDTCSDWQFSLFEYEDVKQAGVQKIPGSLVAQRENVDG